MNRVEGLAREFRGVWVASFMNIDWPSQKGLDSATLASEADALLDAIAAAGFNAVLFQARPCGDALYRSSIVPWSAYVSGVQGQAPEGSFDPLRYWIEGAHKRGLELHAWLNPYRVGHPSVGTYSTSPAYDAFTVEIGEKGYRWLDPGSEEARRSVINAALEIAGNYDIDGMILDDYFYPYNDILYPLQDFPDEESFASYRSEGGTLGKGDWRRNNVNALVAGLSKALREEKDWLRIGISPFGIWRPGYPSGVRGKDSFEECSTDALFWIDEGWLDYIAPQLYWPISAPDQSLTALCAWWGSEAAGADVWPSVLFENPKVGPEARSLEFESELAVIRALAALPSKGVSTEFRPGMLCFSAKSLIKPGNAFSPGLSAIRAARHGSSYDGPFTRRALPPSLRRGRDELPLAPIARIAPGGDGLEWERRFDLSAYVVEVRRRETGSRGVIRIELLARDATEWKRGEGLEAEIRLFAVDRYGFESLPAVFTFD